MIPKIIRYLIDSNYRFKVKKGHGVYNKLSDEEYLKLCFKQYIGKDLNLENPKTFNEKIQWLKLYDRNPEYTRMVDKYLVRDYIAKTIGPEYLIPLIGVWDHPDEIDFDNLPNQFVLKCNHNSGLGMCICKDKTKLNVNSVKNELKKGLSQDYYLTGREWPYKDVPRKIIAEKYMVDDSGYELKDYKLHCFNGTVKYTLVCSDRFSGLGERLTFFDREWSVMPLERRRYPKSEVEIKKPKSYEKMVELAEKLAKNIPFVRVDFYDVNGKIYFGELTFYPGSGFEEFVPYVWDENLGDCLVLPTCKNDG